MTTFRSLRPAAALAAALLLPAAAHAATVAYTLDPGHTQVQFHWSHLQFSHPGANFDRVAGRLDWDAEDITRSSVSVTMPVAGLHTHVDALDAELKTAPWFDAEKFPNVTFASTRVERTKDKRRFRITGNLTARGVTRVVVLDATLNHVGPYPMLEVPAVGFDATTRIKRSDFGLGNGVPMVGDELDVRITVEAMEAAPYEKAMKAFEDKAAGGKK
jgi:polyisoprenoid-binding protein YceI